MFSHGYYVFSSSFFEQFDPFLCIEFFSFEQRDKIFVAKFILRSPRFNMVFIYMVVFLIHIA